MWKKECIIFATIIVTNSAYAQQSMPALGFHEILNSMLGLLILFFCTGILWVGLKFVCQLGARHGNKIAEKLSYLRG